METTTTARQSPYIGQVWLRKNDWWRYLVVLAVVGVARRIFKSFSHEIFPPVGSGWTAGFVISGLAAGGAFVILFYMVHQAPLQLLINTFSKIRFRHLLTGTVVILIVFFSEVLMQALFLGVKDVNFNLDPFTFFKALSAGLLLGIVYSINLSISFSYAFPAAVKWLLKPKFAFLIVLIYINLDTFMNIFSFEFILSLPYLLASSLIFMLMIVWILLDDGIEMMIGYTVGSTILSNAFIKMGVGVGSWGKPLVEITLKDHNLEFWHLNILRAVIVLLCTLFLYRYMNWQHWRTRLFSRYTKPAFSDEWTSKIDEIGEK